MSNAISSCCLDLAKYTDWFTLKLLHSLFLFAIVIYLQTEYLWVYKFYEFMSCIVYKRVHLGRLVENLEKGWKNMIATINIKKSNH